MNFTKSMMKVEGVMSETGTDKVALANACGVIAIQLVNRLIILAIALKSGDAALQLLL